MITNYRVRHETKYAYGQQVPLCHNQARVLPRSMAWQQVSDEVIRINPEPEYSSEHVDYFGNRVMYYSIQHPHQGSETTAEFRVRVDANLRPDACRSTTTWHELQQQLVLDAPSVLLPIRPWTYTSPRIPRVDAVTDFAMDVFSEREGLIDACSTFMARIFNEFTFDAESTDVTTSLEEAFAGRRGVCQDFTHIMLAGLRGLGLPARYMSGYLETIPPPGQPKLEGADATHAWVAVYDPAIGWVDFDPTNNLLPKDQHITLGWGRDFADIIPVKGVVTGGSNQRLDVSVDVKRES